MSSVYAINKGVGKAIEFKGFKAQYIWWLAAGLLGLLIVFAILYILGVNTFITLAIILGGGTAWVMHVYKLSHRYGQYGMMKTIARRSIPGVVKCKGRQVFITLKKISDPVKK